MMMRPGIEVGSNEGTVSGSECGAQQAIATRTTATTPVAPDSLALGEGGVGSQPERIGELVTLQVSS